MGNNNHIFIVEDGRVKIKGIYVGLPTEQLIPVLLEQGFTISSPSVFVGDIEGLGNCRLTIREGKDSVGLIGIRTKGKCTEEEVRAVIEQVNNDLHAKPGFDYNGFGIASKPHEIDHFWDIDEGMLTIQWDGFNIHGFSSKNDDGLDHISFCLQGPVVKDEEYWRSEVD